MFFVVRSNDSFKFPLGLIKYIVIVTECSQSAWLFFLTLSFPDSVRTDITVQVEWTYNTMLLTFRTMFALI